MILVSIFLVLLCLVALPPASAQWTIGQEVKTTSGIVKGHADKTYPEVSTYLGIRFGHSTAGTNRFMPPQLYTSAERIDASAFGAACPQNVPPGVLFSLIGSLALPSKMSEDCLFVNVWTKPQAWGEKKKAVLVWIYGGAFTTGDSDNKTYYGNAMANNEDLVVVSFNYRVNYFGFPGAPFLTDLNPGLLDQRLAIEWVRDNIAAFGGDPRRITIYGESAGGSSVDYYAYPWAKDGIVNGMIASSGTAMMTGPFSLTRRVTPDKGWYQLSKKVGCGGLEAGNATLACIQGKSVKELQAAIPGPSGKGVESLVGAFGPTIDNRVVFDNVYVRAKAGDFVRKPLLVGTNHNESTLFTYIAYFTSPMDAADVVSLQNGFNCGAADAAKARQMLDIPVWRYHFANNKPGKTDGAWHGDEVSFVFGDGKTGLSKLFQPAYAAFIRDPVNGLSQHGWPRYDYTRRTLIRLAPNQKIETDFVQADMYDGTCPPAQI